MDGEQSGGVALDDGEGIAVGEILVEHGERAVNVHLENTRTQNITCVSSVVRAFAHGAMGRRVDPSWGRPIELFLVPASVPRLV